MTEAYKVLAQVNPPAITLTTLYTTPPGKQAVVSSIVVCNNAGTAGTFRISVRVGGAADNAKQYLYRDMSIPANNTFIATIGITLNASDIISIYASSVDLAFNAFGTEVS